MAPRTRQYWLMKSEPDTYSVDHLKQQQRAPWEGVRSFQARNIMRQMAIGDLAFFYHSSTTPPGVVGLMTICREAYPDDTQFDPKSPYYDEKSKPSAPRWDRVDVEFVEKFPQMVTLEELKADPKLDEMLVRRRGMRLSVQPVSAAHFKHILKLAQARSR